MMQVCMQCGAVYDEPTVRCTAKKQREVWFEGVSVRETVNCLSMQWCYPAPEPPVVPQESESPPQVEPQVEQEVPVVPPIPVEVVTEPASPTALKSKK